MSVKSKASEPVPMEEPKAPKTKKKKAPAPPKPVFKSGFVAIIGRPNVGKSTFLNAVLGKKAAIVSNKPNTTRNVIKGVKNGEGYQIVFLDTPDLDVGKTLLHKTIVEAAWGSLEGVDAVL